MGGVTFDHGQQVAVDKDGNIYLTGTFEGTAYFEQDTLVALGMHDVFLSKFDSTGQLLWSRKAGGTAKDQSLALTVNSLGEVLIAGMFEGWMYLESDTLKSVDGSDLFLAKYSPKGALIWSRREGGKGFDGGYDITCDMNNNVYLLGNYTNLPEDRAIGALERQKGNHIFVGKYSHEGELIWVKPTRGEGAVFGNSILVDAKENVYVSGEYYGEVIFSKDTLPPSPGIMYAKYDKEGQITWINRLIGDGIRGFGADLTFDRNGNLLMTGSYAGIGVQEEELIGSVGEFDLFATSLHPEDGSVNWWYSAGGENIDKGMGIYSIDSLVFITGWIFETASFSEDAKVKAFGGNNMFLATLSDKGEFISVYNPPQRGLGYGKALAGDADGNLYWAGWFSGMMNLPTDLLFSNGKADVFLGKFKMVIEE